VGNCCGGTGGGARAGENETRYFYRRRFGNALARDLQHLFLNEWIAHPLGEFFAFARLGAVLVGLALRHRTAPKT
jgi:hypothetical protein